MKEVVADFDGSLRSRGEDEWGKGFLDMVIESAIARMPLSIIPRGSNVDNFTPKRFESREAPTIWQTAITLPFYTALPNACNAGLCILLISTITEALKALSRNLSLL